MTKAFGRVQALDGLNLSVKAGSVHGFLGPNGAGKTTAIRAILGQIRLDGGRLRVFGLDPAKEAVDVRRRLAYVPGDTVLWPNLTGGECIDILGRMQGSIDAARRAELIERFELNPRMKTRTYSKGNRQKVALVAALATRAELLLLDEPTSALDPAGRRAVLRLIARLAEHATVILSSHNLEEVQRVCTHAVVLREGKAVAASTISGLRERAGDHSLLLVSGGGDPLAQALNAEPWCAGVRREGADFIVVVSDPSAAARALPALIARGGWDLSALTPLEPSLEDVFTALTEGK